VALTFGFALADAQVGSAQTGPTCTPATLNNSALQPGGVTVSPMPGSRDASPQTQISFLGVPKGKLSVLSVVGSRTGSHSGRFIGYSQGNGASFLPSRPFAEGERVTVHASVRVGSSKQALLDVFAIAYPDAITTTPAAEHAGSASEVQRFHSRPDLQPPLVTVGVNSPATAPGDLFLAPYSGVGQPGPMILEPNGGLLWFKPLPRYTSATDLRVQEYAGKPVLTWWQGDVSVHGYGIGEGVIADSSYVDIAHVTGGNGHQVDLHDFQLTPRGTALVTSYFPIRCNLSSVGGPADAGLTDGVLQEIDVKTGLVTYEWTALGHIALSESYVRARYVSVPEPWDYFHINTINLDKDGSLLISGRNTWAVYELGAGTGQVLWRLGGKHSSFKEAANLDTAWQHDARELPDGTISIFDNGSYPKVHPQSRAIIVKLEQQSHTAALLGELTHNPPIVSESEGDVQALSNGDWFVGWGQYPEFTEFSPTGQVLFDARLPPSVRSYRDLRFPWSGLPAHPPTFVLLASAKGGGTVYASWNGATGVALWRVLAGASATALSTVAEAPRSAFESSIAVPAGTLGPYLAVQAIDASGNVLGTSPAVSESSLKAAG